MSAQARRSRSRRNGPSNARMASASKVLTTAVVSAHAGGHADGGRHPKARRRGETPHLVFLAALQDGAGAEEADAGHDALHHAAQAVAADAGLQGHQHEHGRADRHKHVRADACVLALIFALVAHEPAQESRQGESQHEPGELLQVGQVRELGGDGPGDGVPGRHVRLPRIRAGRGWARAAPCRAGRSGPAARAAIAAGPSGWRRTAWCWPAPSSRSHASR
jgi:hypothetical protein